MINKKKLQNEYRSVRARHSLTLRDAARILGVKASFISEIEKGSPPIIEQDKTQEVTAICHICSVEFKAHPLLVDGQPIAFPHWVCKQCEME